MLEAILKMLVRIFKGTLVVIVTQTITSKGAALLLQNRTSVSLFKGRSLTRNLLCDKTP